MSDTTQKKEFPNSGALFRVPEEKKVNENSNEYEGNGEIDVTEAIPAGTKLLFFIDAKVREFTNRRTGQKQKFFALKFKIKGKGKASPPRPAAAGFGGAPAAPATPAKAPPEENGDNPNFEY